MVPSRTAFAALDPKAPDPLDVEAGRRIRALRLARNLSQEQLAQAIGVSFQQLQKYEGGTNRISFSRMIRAARFLRVDATLMVAGLSDGEGPLPALPASRANQELLSAAQALPPGLQRVLRDLAVGLAAAPAAPAPTEAH